MLIACNGPPPATKPIAAAAELAAAPVSAPAVVEPTALTDDQQRRDAAYEALARTVVDAYANWIGWYSPLIANWSPDGTQFLFGSLRDGTPQIYAGDPGRPADPPRAITSGPERASWASFTRDGKHILFLRDNQGDENYHIWRIDADGSSQIDLTPDESQMILEPMLPRERPDMLVYSTLALPGSGTGSRVLVQNITGGPPRLVFSAPTSGSLGGVTPDGARALYFEAPAPHDTVLLELELAAGTSRRIYPPAGKLAAVHTAAYSADGARILVTTDEGAESSSLLALDARSGEELARYTHSSPPSARLGVLVSPTGDHVIINIDAGNHSALRVLDARTLALVRPIEAPLAQVWSGAFRPDGKEFSVLISRPDHPPDLFAVDPSRDDLRPLRDDPRPGLAGLPAVTATIAEVPAHDGLTIPINVYLPATGPDQPVARRPTLVMFHGGPAWSSEIRWDEFVRFFSALGYAVLEPNVRGSTGFGRAYEMADNREKRADWLKDLETVNAWTRAQPWCDPARVAVWGASYGGYTTLMALTRHPTSWRAGVDVFGVADLKTFLRTTAPAVRNGLEVEFGNLERDAALLEEFSPMRDVDKIVAPLFVYAGQNDPRVPRSESDMIVQALRQRGIPVEYMVALDEGHSFDRRENKIELLTRTARFLADAMPP
nr:prolyl oligopeptidase family serine peptidase [Nannocystis sp. RBIL2]